MSTAYVLFLKPRIIFSRHQTTRRVKQRAPPLKFREQWQGIIFMGISRKAEFPTHCPARTGGAANTGALGSTPSSEEEFVHPDLPFSHLCDNFCSDTSQSCLLHTSSQSHSLCLSSLTLFLQVSCPKSSFSAWLFSVF